jgi:cell division septation protein DedD
MQYAVHDGTPFVNQPMIKRGHVLGKDRTAAIDVFVVADLKPPGLRPIKQVEMYKKFRLFVPRRFWDETCPKPSDEVMMQIKDETAKKRKQKTAAKPPQAVAVKRTDVKPTTAKTLKATGQAKKRRAEGEAAKKQVQNKPNVKKRQAAPESDTDSDWSVSE